LLEKLFKELEVPSVSKLRDIVANLIVINKVLVETKILSGPSAFKCISGVQLPEIRQARFIAILTSKIFPSRHRFKIVCKSTSLIISHSFVMIDFHALLQLGAIRFGTKGAAMGVASFNANSGKVRAIGFAFLITRELIVA
jgi:hypothetical protein